MHAGPPQDPQQVLAVAPDTYLIRELTDPGGPVRLYINSLVITAREPVLVDTGTAGNRAGWLEDAFSLVDPADVRWVVISHDDHDHVGSLVEVLERCPNATMVTSWLSTARLARDYAVPLTRMRWVNDGDTLDVGDRTLVFARPPLYDSPSSIGLYDPRSATYWAVDSFGAPVTEPADDAADIEADAFDAASSSWARMISPWHTMLDPVRFGASLDRVALLGAATVASAHGPLLRGERIRRTFEIMRGLPDADPVELPGQPDLEAMLAATAVSAMNP